MKEARELALKKEKEGRIKYIADDGRRKSDLMNAMYLKQRESRVKIMGEDNRSNSRA